MSKRDRRLACKLAAKVMAGRNPETPFVPEAWSLVVFFERYIEVGAKGTLKDFGPKEPEKLKVIR